MRVLVCGGRDYADGRHLIAELDRLHEAMPFSVVIEGDAPGADWMAGSHPPEQWVRGRFYADPGWAWVRRIPGEHYPADWDRHGKAAGPIRNRQMLDEGKPDLVIAFPGGRGTANMIEQAERAGVPVRRIT